MSDIDTPDKGAGEPLLRIVRGTPDDTEIAALTTALISLTTARTATHDTEKPISLWAHRPTALRRTNQPQPLRPGPGAWRSSLLPR